MYVDLNKDRHSKSKLYSASTNKYANKMTLVVGVKSRHLPYCTAYILLSAVLISLEDYQETELPHK